MVTGALLVNIGDVLEVNSVSVMNEELYNDYETKKTY
jgi:hypothetical protein